MQEAGGGNPHTSIGSEKRGTTTNTLMHQNTKDKEGCYDRSERSET